MRQIEKAMLSALRENRTARLNNTDVVVINDTEKAVFLHGHKIARYTCGKFYVSLCGWNTTTTRSRLRALGVNVTTKQGTPYIGGEAVTSYGVFEIDRYTGNLAK